MCLAYIFAIVPPYTYNIYKFSILIKQASYLIRVALVPPCCKSFRNRTGRSNRLGDLF